MIVMLSIVLRSGHRSDRQLEDPHVSQDEDGLPCLQQPYRNVCSSANAYRGSKIWPGMMTFHVAAPLWPIPGAKATKSLLSTWRLSTAPSDLDTAALADWAQSRLPPTSIT